MRGMLSAGGLLIENITSPTMALRLKSRVEMVIPVASRRDSGHHYRVTLSDSGDECDCPDFYWRHINRGDESHRCKHIAAARQLLVDGIPAPAEGKRQLRAQAAPHPR
jgi:hypothetical protein